MKRPAYGWVSRRPGFTLVEVLIALAVAAIGFGVVLHSIGLQLTMVATSLDRHQMLMYASEALEAGLARGTLGDEEVNDQPIGKFGRTESESAAEVSKYVYGISTKPVTADPRVEQVSVTVRGGRGNLRLSAYRIRVKRDSN